MPTGWPSTLARVTTRSPTRNVVSCAPFAMDRGVGGAGTTGLLDRERNPNIPSPLVGYLPLLHVRVGYSLPALLTGVVVMLADPCLVTAMRACDLHVGHFDNLSCSIFGHVDPAKQADAGPIAAIRPLPGRPFPLFVL